MSTEEQEPDAWAVFSETAASYDPTIEEAQLLRDRTNGDADRKKTLPPPTLPEILSLDQLLASTDPPYDWLVPGLIERCDRIVLTGLEGKGKSTLWRQLGAQLAAGIHPFGGAPFAPVKVLIVDCENSKRQVRRKVGVLREAAGAGANLLFVFRPDGIRLNLPDAEAWLEALVTAVRPDVLIIGPVYKMASGNPNDEQAAKAVSDVLDRLRMKYGFAVLLEAHTPYAESSRSKRPERPYGASLWSRWPEFGIYLADDGKLTHWRGQRDEREWPAKLKRGSEWPWEVDDATTAAEPEVWDGPRDCMAKVLTFLDDAAGVEYSGSSLASALHAVGITFKAKTVRDAAERLAAQRKINVRPGPRSGRYFSALTQQTLTPGPADEPF